MHITISVFFSGTNHPASHDSTLVYLLKEHIEQNEKQIAMAFDGCGITHGWRGTIFGSGMDEPCQKVIECVEEEIKKENTVSLNVYGHSRGGNTALMLAKQLSAIDPNLLEINLGLMDPVPGNFITTSTLDFFEISLAKKTMDLRDCKPLKNVLALYPHQPLPTLAVHAPLFSLYPKHTMVEEDVIAGCHSGAQFQEFFNEQIQFSRESFITFARMFEFFKTRGTQFKPLPNLNVQRMPTLTIDIDHLDKALLNVYDAENRNFFGKFYRDTHSATGVYIDTKAAAEFFNLHHQRLAGEALNIDNVRVTIEEKKGPISRLKRVILHYPKTWQALKWSFLSVGLVSLIFFTGGFSAFPLLGAWSILTFAPIIGASLAALWYGVLKPVSQWSINRFFYPKFHIREIHPVIEQHVPGSSPMLVRALGVEQAGEGQLKPQRQLKVQREWVDDQRRTPDELISPTIYLKN